MIRVVSETIDWGGTRRGLDGPNWVRLKIVVWHIFTEAVFGSFRTGQP